MVENREEKSNKKETGGKGRKEPVKIVVKPVYVGKQEMAEVFGSVALENIRRKMTEIQEKQKRKFNQNQLERWRVKRYNGLN